MIVENLSLLCFLYVIQWLSASVMEAGMISFCPGFKYSVILYKGSVPLGSLNDHERSEKQQGGSSLEGLVAGNRGDQFGTVLGSLEVFLLF